jgi:hypothetical protein
MPRVHDPKRIREPLPALDIEQGALSAVAWSVCVGPGPLS